MTGVWEGCKLDDDYEINTEFPYPIRRKSTQRIVTESLNMDGYCRLKMNSKDYRKHRVVAVQWVPNPHNYTIVDHKNQDHTDYHVENLEWVSYSMNNKNKKSNRGVVYEWLDEIPTTAEVLTEYNNKPLEEGYYIDRTNHKLYIKVRDKYRELQLITSKGHHYYNCRYSDGKPIRLTYSIIM